MAFVEILEGPQRDAGAGRQADQIHRAAGVFFDVMVDDIGQVQRPQLYQPAQLLVQRQQGQRPDERGHLTLISGRLEPLTHAEITEVGVAGAWAVEGDPIGGLLRKRRHTADLAARQNTCNNRNSSVHMSCPEAAV